MNINIKQNKKPTLLLPKFNVDGILNKKLNEYSISSLMNKSNFTLFLGKPGSGKTSLMTSFLKTPSFILPSIYRYLLVYAFLFLQFY